ncbi:alpha/beta hydrolase [Paenibacillus montaniterrae]|uniref:Alpha/beta hydrolase n=1 Tax=Paenibacillus montaniterrae TaxID=429341 RepID=A0A920D0C0_9BACL|nr:alpha/beta hydrolase [Paenibacillus montaniterrae]GIP19415.1 alpha/beta hydrolase [Paenibacillus montaniterrae]
MKKMLKKKRWWLFIFIILVGAAGVALFYDDGSVSSFVDQQGKAEYIEAYNEAMSHLPELVEERQISTTFGEVKVYKFEGESMTDRAPLLLLPGKSASTPMWEPNLDSWLKDRPVYTIDLLGEPGMSVETARIENVQDQAVWLKELIIALDEPKIHLLGLSFGGWSAVNLVVHEEIPQIASLILVDPVYVFDAIPLKMVLLSIPASVPIIPKSIRDRMLSYISGEAEIDENEPTAKLIETGMRTFKSKLPMPQQIKESQLNGINIPVLAIIAGKSTMHHPEKAAAVAEESLSHENSEVVVFEEASHAINGEYPEELADAIQQFITPMD